MNVLLGFLGNETSGKSIVIDHLIHKYNFSVFSRNDILRFKLLESSETLKYKDVFSEKKKEMVSICMNLINSFYTNNCPDYLPSLLVKTIKESPGGVSGLRCVIPDLCTKEEFDRIFKNEYTFVVNNSITDTAVTVKSIFDYRLILNVNADFDKEKMYNEFPQPIDVVDSDCFLSSGSNKPEFISSLDLILKGVLEK